MADFSFSVTENQIFLFFVVDDAKCAETNTKHDNLSHFHDFFCFRPPCLGFGCFGKSLDQKVDQHSMIFGCVMSKTGQTKKNWQNVNKKGKCLGFGCFGKSLDQKVSFDQHSMIFGCVMSKTGQTKKNWQNVNKKRKSGPKWFKMVKKESNW